jgi:hypothetical protein
MMMENKGFNLILVEVFLTGNTNKKNCSNFSCGDTFSTASVICTATVKFYLQILRQCHMEQDLTMLKIVNSYVISK